MFAIIAVFLIAFVIWYALAGRRWLKTTALGSRFLAWIEPVEIVLYRKSETLLVGRLMWLGSAIVMAYDSLAVFAVGLDWTPITSRLLSFIPDDLRGIAVAGVLGLIGLIISWLRKRTAKPIELIAAATTPDTVIAEAKVDAANASAAAVVAAAEAAKA